MQSINKLKGFLTGLVLFCTIGSMAQEPTVGIKAGAPIIPTGEFPSHIANKGYGGYHTTDDRHSISEYFRSEGMVVYDTTDNKMYVLDSDLETWIDYEDTVIDSSFSKLSGVDFLKILNIEYSTTGNLSLDLHNTNIEYNSEPIYKDTILTYGFWNSSTYGYILTLLDDIANESASDYYSKILGDGPLGEYQGNGVFSGTSIEIIENNDIVVSIIPNSVILEKIKEIDGAGSGIDADLLDGLDSTAFQPTNSTLSSISLLGTAANKMPYTTGINTWAETSLTTVGRSLLAADTVIAQRTALGLGTAAVVDLQTTINSSDTKAATPGAVQDYAQPLENQRLSSTNSPAFVEVTLTNAVSIASASEGIVPSLDGTYFYDTGLTNEGEKVQHDNTGTYAKWYDGTQWLITTVTISVLDPEEYSYDRFVSATENGAYTGYGAWSGTLTFSVANMSVKEELGKLWTGKQPLDDTLTKLSGRGRSYPVFQFNMMYWEVEDGLPSIKIGTEVELKASTNNFSVIDPFEYWGDSMHTNLASYITFANADTNCVFYYTDYSTSDGRPLVRLDMATMYSDNTMLTDYIGSGATPDRTGFHQYIYMIPDASDARFSDWMHEANDENISWVWRPRTAIDTGPKDADGHLIWWPIRPVQWVSKKAIGRIN